MARPKALTNQQEKFCYYLVFGNPETGNPCSKSEAAKLAGYKDPVFYGSRLCNVDKYPLVVAFKHELERELKEKYSINYDGHVSKMGELRDLAKYNKQFSSAIRAEELRGRLQGYYVEQKAILHKKVTAEDAKKNINKYEDIVKARKITSKLIKD